MDIGITEYWYQDDKGNSKVLSINFDKINDLLASTEISNNNDFKNIFNNNIISIRNTEAENLNTNYTIDDIFKEIKFVCKNKKESIFDNIHNGNANNGGSYDDINILMLGGIIDELYNNRESVKIINNIRFISPKNTVYNTTNSSLIEQMPKILKDLGIEKLNDIHSDTISFITNTNNTGGHSRAVFINFKKIKEDSGQNSKIDDCSKTLLKNTKIYNPASIQQPGCCYLIALFAALSSAIINSELAENANIIDIKSYENLKQHLEFLEKDEKYNSKIMSNTFKEDSINKKKNNEQNKAKLKEVDYKINAEKYLINIDYNTINTYLNNDDLYENCTVLLESVQNRGEKINRDDIIEGGYNNIKEPIFEAYLNTRTKFINLLDSISENNSTVNEIDSDTGNAVLLFLLIKEALSLEGPEKRENKLKKLNSLRFASPKPIENIPEGGLISITQKLLNDVNINSLLDISGDNISFVVKDSNNYSRIMSINFKAIEEEIKKEQTNLDDIKINDKILCKFLNNPEYVKLYNPISITKGKNSCFIANLMLPIIAKNPDIINDSNKLLRKTQKTLIENIENIDGVLQDILENEKDRVSPYMDDFPIKYCPEIYKTFNEQKILGEVFRQIPVQNIVQPKEILQNVNNAISNFPNNFDRNIYHDFQS